MDADEFEQLQVRLYGGRVSESITDSTTHMVVLPSTGSPAPEQASAVRPGDLLTQLLKDHGGLPALKILHRQLLAQQVHVVSQRWELPLTCPCWEALKAMPGYNITGPPM